MGEAGSTNTEDRKLYCKITEMGKGTRVTVSQVLSMDAMDAMDGDGGMVGVYFDDSRPGVDRRRRKAEQLIPNLHFLNYHPFSLPLSMLISC